MSEGKYIVMLLSSGNTTSNKVNIIKTVLDTLNIPMREAKDLVDGAPCILMKDATYDIAIALKQEIEKYGGMVNLIEMEQSSGENAISSGTEFDSMKDVEVVTDDSGSGFTSPNNDGGVPTFSSPDAQKSASVFSSSDAQKSAPTFSSPDDQKSAPTFSSPDDQKSAPTFSSPDDQKSAPKFTTPEQHNGAPKFTAPGSQSHDEERCAYHPKNRAVIKCNNCGKPICDACKEAGELTDGTYVCYDCASAMVQKDIDIATAKRSEMVRSIIFSIIGAVVFAFLSATPFAEILLQSGSGDGTAFLQKVLFVLFGAALPVYFPAIKAILRWIWKVIRWKPGISKVHFIFDFIVTCIKVTAVVLGFTLFLIVFSIFLAFSPIVALILVVLDVNRYKKADELVQRNQEILQRLTDRMEYIRIQSEENADNEALANDSRMQGNQFAEAIRREGYANASKVFSDEAQEMAENDRKIKKFVLNEYGEAVRAA